MLFEFGTLNGGERSILAVIDQLDRQVWQFVAVAPPNGRLAAALAERKIEHVPFDVHASHEPQTIRAEIQARLHGVIHDLQPDLVHANSLSMGRWTGAIAEQLDCPCTAHLRDILKVSPTAMLDLNRHRSLFAVSRATRDYHLAQGLDERRTQVVYNGVDCNVFSPRASNGYLRRELGLDASAFLVLTIGQIGLRKGQDVLAEAAAINAERLPNVHYLLVGERNSSKAESVAFERNVIERFAAAGLDERLLCLGYRDDVPMILNDVDLLVHSAHQEPLGRVLLEAGASGTPIVATRVGGTAEILSDGVSARLIPPNDPTALAQAIAEMHDDPERRGWFAGQARARIATLFSIERAAAAHEVAWRAALGVS